MSDHQISTNSDSNKKRSIPKRKSGTIESGHEYEHLITAKIILELINNNKIDDFGISSNDANYGKFDDIIVDLKTGKTNIVYAFQLKHKENKNSFININNLKAAKGDFSLQNYFESLEEIKGNFNKLILYTNSKFNIENNKNDKFSIEEEKIVIKIRNYKIDELINIYNCFKFDIIESKSDEAKTESYRKFFDCFILCTNQNNCQTTEKHLFEMFKNNFFCGEIEYYRFKSLVKNCSNTTKDIQKLNKLWMREAIALCLVSSKIQPIKFSYGCSNKETKLLEEMISKFCVSHFKKEESSEKLQELWKDKYEILINMALKEINRLRKKYHILLTNIDDINTVDDKVKTELLWLMKAVPLILTHDKTVEEAIRIYPEGKYVIICNKDVNIVSFRCLLDVKTISPFLFEEVTQKFKLSLQGKDTINIADFTDNKEELMNIFTSDILLQMAFGNVNIGGRKEDVAETYINRILEKPLIKSSYVHQADTKTLIIIDRQNIKDSSNMKCKIITVENDCTFEDFENICQKHLDCKKFRYFKSVYGNLLLYYSKGGIDDLQEYKVIVQEEEKCFWNLEEPNVNLLLSDAGMGKSELMKNLKNNCNPKFWVMIMNSNDMKLFLKKYDDDLVNFLLNEKYKNFTMEELALIKVMENNNRVVYIWDGVDEISEQDLDKIIGVIVRLKANRIIQWVGGRPRVKAKLESALGLIPMDLTLINEEGQSRYIRLRLSKNSQAKIEQALQVIKRNFELINHINILGIPLQLYMITELFRQNMERYLEKSKTECTLTYLYRYFVDEKFYTYWKEKNKINFEDLDDSIKRSLEKSKNEYLQLCQKISLKLIFPDCVETTIDSEKLLKCFKDIDPKNAIGIIKEISDVNTISFIHLSFAEYFTACYLVENDDIIKENIFKERFNNVRFFRDLLLAEENCPAHTSILYREYEKLTEYAEEILYKEDKGGRNLLHLMCSWGERYPLISVNENKFINESIHTILMNKAKPEATDYIDNLKQLQKQCSFFKEDSLLKLHPISYALKCGCFTTVSRLLENLNYFKIEENVNILLYAIIYGINDNLHLFENTKYLDLRFNDGSTLFHLACGSGFTNIVARLKEYGADLHSSNSDGETPLHLASRYGHEDIARYLVDSGVAVDVCDSESSTPLQWASHSGHEKIVNYLIDSGAAINHCDSKGRTALHYASGNGQEKIAQYLIKSGAAIDQSDCEDATPLNWASYNGHENVVKFLVESGAAIDQCNCYGRTPLHNASMNGHEEIARFLIESGAAVNCYYFKDRTPLLNASGNGHESLARCLIKSGAAINHCDSKGQTPLHWASQYGHKTMVQCLLECGAEINQSDFEGLTSLHYASMKGQEKVVQCLIESGAEISQCDFEGRTSLQWALINGYEKIAQYLIEFGARISQCDTE